MATLKRIISISTLIYVSKSIVHLPASCLNQQDGYQWLKPLEGDEYPPINQKCDNEHIIIDLNRDENVKHYFSSYDTWHYALSGPSEMDGSNWEEWFLPNKQHIQPDNTNNYFSYILSPDCTTCDILSNNENNLYSMSNDDSYGDRTAYYMTGTIFGCLFPHKALRDCVWDYNTYQCQYCTVRESDGDLGYHTMDITDNNNNLFFYKELYSQMPTWNILQISLCGVYPQSTYTKAVPQTRKQCNSFQQNIKPSIGNNGKFCVCVKPTDDFNQYNAMSATGFEQYKHQFIQYNKPKEIGTMEHIIKLYPSDFLQGTYRITRSGTYKIMSDIEFDFNAGDLSNPNQDNAWWPRTDQIDEYPGAYSTRDEYFMGFFAGITVEADDVIIDLNGYEIRQSLAFYYQQRFFSCIALKSVVFSLNEGPGIFGTDPHYASNVVIKNGKIGLSSHHGIHGQHNNDVTIENVHIHSFETHGIELSAFNDIKLKNIEIGPSSNIAYLKGEYAYARFTLQRLERIYNSDDINEEIFPIQFDGRDNEMEFIDVINNLKILMDIAFKSVMNIEEYDDTNNDYIAAKELFINTDGIPYGAVMYGLFLNLKFANVFAIHPSLEHSHSAIIGNLNIHDLKHKTDEYLRFDKFKTAPYKNPYNAAFSAESILGRTQINEIMNVDNIDWNMMKYIGDALIDAHIVLNLVTNNWSEKGLMLIDNDFSEWTFGNYKWDNNKKETHPYIGCNGDRMTHVAKGIIGIRMDGIEDVKYHNLNVYNLYEYSDLGSDVCGKYWDEDFKQFEGKGHFLQNVPYLYGYTGNMAHGIFADWSIFSFVNEINIHDIYSKTGLVRAIGLYTNNKLTFKDDNVRINIYNMHAGYALDDINTMELEHPYALAVVKPFHIIDRYVYDGTHVFFTEINDKYININDVINIWCMFGKDGIENDYDKYNVINNDDCDDIMDMDLYKYDTMTFSSVKQNDHYSSALIWSLVMILCIVGLVVIVYVLNKCYLCFRYKGMNNQLEYMPLTSKHFSYYYGSYS